MQLLLASDNSADAAFTMKRGESCKESRRATSVQALKWDQLVADEKSQ